MLAQMAFIPLTVILLPWNLQSTILNWSRTLSNPVKPSQTPSNHSSPSSVLSAVGPAKAEASPKAQVRPSPPSLCGGQTIRNPQFKSDAVKPSQTGSNQFGGQKSPLRPLPSPLSEIKAYTSHYSPFTIHYSLAPSGTGPVCPARANWGLSFGRTGRCYVRLSVGAACALKRRRKERTPPPDFALEL
jgi:hypothetical protein